MGQGWSASTLPNEKRHFWVRGTGRGERCKLCSSLRWLSGGWERSGDNLGVLVGAAPGVEGDTLGACEEGEVMREVRLVRAGILRYAMLFRRCASLFVFSCATGTLMVFCSKKIPPLEVLAHRCMHW